MKPDTTDLVARIEAALKPFAEIASKMQPGAYYYAQPDGALFSPHRTTLGDFRRAAEAITALPALLAAVREGEAEVEKLRAATEPHTRPDDKSGEGSHGSD